MDVGIKFQVKEETLKFTYVVLWFLGRFCIPLVCCYFGVISSFVLKVYDLLCIFAQYTSNIVFQ